VERAITFGGGSVVAHPNGSVLARATEERPLISVELSRTELQQARRPYAHVRDELPALVSRELQRILSA
jgi:predicted amidohydrolase